MHASKIFSLFSSLSNPLHVPLAQPTSTCLKRMKHHATRQHVAVAYEQQFRLTPQAKGALRLVACVAVVLCLQKILYVPHGFYHISASDVVMPLFLPLRYSRRPTTN